MSAPFSPKSARSRVVVAGDAPVMVLYLPALIPPLNPSGPSLNIRGELNDRQEKAILRMFKEGPEGFKGGMSAGKYSTITGASPATTTRDLADLGEKGALIREGERRHARYKLNVPLRHVPHISVNERGEIIEGLSHGKG